MSPFMIAGFALIAAVIVIALLAAVFFSGLFPFGFIVGSGNLQTQEKSLSDFTIVNVHNGFQVEITKANTYSIEVTADDNVIQHVEVTKTENTLTIQLEPGFGYQSPTLRAKISMPDFEEAQLSGGSNIKASSFNLTHNFRAELSGGSVLEMDGGANDLVAECSGGSRLEFSDFAVDNVNVDFSGGSRGTINVNGRLDAQLSGGSQLFYIGNPTLGDIETSGGSNIVKK